MSTFLTISEGMEISNHLSDIFKSWENYDLYFDKCLLYLVNDYLINNEQFDL